MRLKMVMRYDPSQHKLRILRFLWTRGKVGDGHGGHSAKLSLSLAPKLLGWSREKYFGWRLTVAGVQLHHLKSYGGTIV